MEMCDHEKGAVIWITGLPSSGKTTLARKLEHEFREMGKKVEVLDGDEVRRWLSPEAGFTREDRERHLRRVAYVSRLLARNGVIVIAAFVSP
ncbi:MAG: adenylyl-sulfate kinase, partial [Thermoproteota archaeon]